MSKFQFGLFGFLISTTAHAYIGPGTGLSGLGAFIALILTVALALLGFVWFPLKRLLKKKRPIDSSKPTSSDIHETNK